MNVPALYRGLTSEKKNAARLQRFPIALAQRFQRFEVGLVRHLRAFFYPVTQIDVRHVELSGLVDLPQDIVGTVRRAGLGGIVERVDRRQSVAELINDAD